MYRAVAVALALSCSGCLIATNSLGARMDSEGMNSKMTWLMVIIGILSLVVALIGGGIAIMAKEHERRQYAATMGVLAAAIGVLFLLVG